MPNRDTVIKKVLKLLNLQELKTPIFGIDAEDTTGNKYRIKYRTLPNKDSYTSFDFTQKELSARFHFLLGVFVNDEGSPIKIVKVAKAIVQKHVAHNKLQYKLRWHQDIQYPIETVFPKISFGSVVRSNNVSAYLMTWNPSKWHWENFKQIAAEVAKGKPLSMRWRTANRHVQKGDRIFIMHLGKEPRGIFASGIATGLPIHHTDGAVDPKKRWYVPIEITTLLDPETSRLLTEEELKSHVSDSFPWVPQGSGILISPEYVPTLEILWQPFTRVRFQSHAKPGDIFSWKQIVDQFQADQTFLSQRNGKIVCATIDLDKNELFPDALFVGTKKRNKERAETLNGQIDPFPMFKKLGKNKWCFEGVFRFRQKVSSGTLFDEAAKFSKRPISSVIFLEPEFDDSVVMLSTKSTAIEGMPRLVNSQRRERNQAIVRLKKNHVLRTTGRLQCEACGFDFKQFYGDNVPDFCEAHHNNPLSGANDNGMNTTLEDLSIICPNCHSATHLLDPMPTVIELSKMIRR